MTDTIVSLYRAPPAGQRLLMHVVLMQVRQKVEPSLSSTHADI